jgi:hypothetical protein
VDLTTKKEAAARLAFDLWPSKYHDRGFGQKNLTYDDGSVGRARVLVGTSVGELELLGQLEVELESGDLVLSLEGIGDVDVDLGSVELTRRAEEQDSQLDTPRRQR